MSGRVSGRRPWSVGAVLVSLVGLLLGLLFVAGTPASAAAKNYKTQLSLTGLANEDNPTGGSQVGIHPGDSVSISAASAPTAGLDKLGLGTLGNTVDGLLGGLANFQVKADLSKLPGGKKDTVLDSKTVKKFSFPKVGTYNFTWTAQRLSLLGVVPINLDGNQLEKAGVKLNAKNQYVGQIVVAKNPPKGGIGVQVPSVSVQPSLPVVGNLPRVTIPGVNTPKIPVPSLGNLNPNQPSTGSSSPPATSNPTKSTTPYQLPISVPEQVVPHGEGGSGSGSSGGGYFSDSQFAGLLPTTGGSNRVSSGSGGSGGSDGSSNAAVAAKSPQTQTVDLASDPSAPSSQLPVILAIVAILALALVAGTYARIFLLKKH